MPGGSLKRVYVWQRAVRFFHWVNVGCIVVLIITGIIIGSPPAIQSSREAYESYWFGVVRFIHFATAYIFMFNIILRIYFAFFGNKWANWRQFVPTSNKFLRDLIQVIKVDILQMKGEPHVAIGHNPLAGLSYFFLFILLTLETITGFGLYAEMSTWWLPQSFAWVPALFGEESIVRLIHHILMWAFIVFAMIHMHLVIFHDFVEGRGETSSMIGGYKFIEEERIEEERIEEEQFERRRHQKPEPGKETQEFND